MTSPALNTPLRSEADAAFAVAHGRQRTALTELSYWLQANGAPERFQVLVQELHERICNEMAGRIRGK